MTVLARVALVLIWTLLPADVALPQEMEEIEHERKLRDLEQLVDTRLAGTAARARALTEQAERAIRGASLRPECEKPPTPADFDVVTAELSAALDSNALRLKREERAYEERLREYEAYRASDSRKIDMYFAIRLQRVNVLDLRSKERNVIAIADSYRKTMPKTTATVEIARCLARYRAGGGEVADSLSAALVRLFKDYRGMLYIVQH